MAKIQIIKPPILEQAPRKKGSPSTVTWTGYRTFDNNMTLVW
jgi:hypothetical protein